VITGTQRMTWKTVPSLLRLNLSLIVSCSALTGFVCFGHAIDLDAWAAFAGVFFLACAASALNQYQEREFDALMDRTKKRPLPMRQISGTSVLAMTFFFGLAGASILYFGTSPVAALLGIITLLWYNGVYTPLKRKTRFAVLVGALTGALPPLIGYTAAGGPIISACLVISLFMFLWQVSHVLVLLVKYGRNMKKRDSLPWCCRQMRKASGFPLWYGLSQRWDVHVRSCGLCCFRDFVFGDTCCRQRTVSGLFLLSNAAGETKPCIYPAVRVALCLSGLRFFIDNR